jgi:hypothetical protein
MNIEMRNYDGAELALPQGWIDNSVVTFISPADDEFRPSIVVTRQRLLDKEPFDAFCTRQRSAIVSAGFTEFKLLSSGPFQVKKQSFFRVSFRWTDRRLVGKTSKTFHLRQDQFHCHKTDRVLTLTASCIEEDWDKNWPVFEAVLGGSRLT